MKKVILMFLVLSVVGIFLLATDKGLRMYLFDEDYLGIG
jgi:hypothetical protein